MNVKLIKMLENLGIDTDCAQCAMEEDEFIASMVRTMANEIETLNDELTERRLRSKT